MVAATEVSGTMWSGFYAAVLGAIAALVSVVLGWFFNQRSKSLAIRKALQLEIDANWKRLENISKESWPGKRLEDLDEAIDLPELKRALGKNCGTISGRQCAVWGNNLVQIVSTLRAQDLKRLQGFYMLLEKLDYMADRNEVEEAAKILFQLFREKKPEIRAAKSGIGFL